MKTTELKPQMIIRINNHNRCWVVLNVTKEDIKKGEVNADTCGLYAFGGMWYGRNPTKIKSYGKIISIDELDSVEIIKTDLQNMSVDTIKSLVD